MASLVRDERVVAGRGSILTRFPLANNLYDQLTAGLSTLAMAPAVVPAVAVADNGSALGGAGIGPAPAPAPAPQHNRYAGEVPLNGNTSSEYSPGDSAGGRRRTRRGRKRRHTSRKN
jgi:hypothetical protein